MNRSFILSLLLFTLVFQGQAQTPDPQALDPSSNDPVLDDSSSSPAQLQDTDFIINGTPYALVLSMQGKVFVRPPDQTEFHALGEDEPIAVGSILVTRADGTLDFATAPGEAIRMNPETIMQVVQLPPKVASPTDTSPPPATVVAVHKGTIFSALGRPDGQAIDFRVRTPQGVAGARGTFFETDAAATQSNVTMFHGKVSLQTYSAEKEAQIEAGSSQGFSGNRQKSSLTSSAELSAADAPARLDKASGLLENACGFGVVRKGLGPETLRGLEQKGFQFSPELKKRFEHVASVHFTHRPGFLNRDRDRDRGARAGGGGGGRRR